MDSGKTPGHEKTTSWRERLTSSPAAIMKRCSELPEPARVAVGVVGIVLAIIIVILLVVYRAQVWTAIVFSVTTLAAAGSLGAFLYFVVLPLRKRRRRTEAAESAPIEPSPSRQRGRYEYKARFAPLQFHTKIRGISRKNEDGTDRQVVARICKTGDHLLLVREPDNEEDPNAVQVWCRYRFLFLARKAQLGYLSREVAEQIAPLLDGGETVEAIVSEVTGGGGGWFTEKKYYGVNIEIVYKGRR